MSNLVSFNIKSLQYLPRSARCALSRLRCNGHSTFLNSYLHRVGRTETPSCRNCGSESQNFSQLVLDCPVLDHLRRAIFGHSLSILDLWSRPWGVARLLGLRGVNPPSPGMARINPQPPPPIRISALTKIKYKNFQVLMTKCVCLATLEFCFNYICSPMQLYPSQYSLIVKLIYLQRFFCV